MATLRQRGYIHDGTAELDSVLSKPTGVYAGYDPTASGLHVGSLVTLMALGHLQRHGHTPIVLLGGATGLIGDPSGRDTERTLMEEGTADSNCVDVANDALSVLERVCDPAGPSPVVLNNKDWYRDMSSLSFLRDVGRHFRVPAMLKRESVSRRMDSHEGISFTEFSYQLLQGHDFYHLNVRHGVCVQLGGSDQWGNITAGVDYAKRRGVKAQLAGLTVPLIQTRDGAKLGKSAGNAIWLSPKKTSHFDLYQYFAKTPTDEVVALWMSLMTMLSLEEIQAALRAADGSAQRILARNVVKLLRGEEAANEAEEASMALYYSNSSSAEALNVVVVQLGGAASISALDLALRCGIVDSKGEAKRLVAQGGLYLDGVRIEEAGALVHTGRQVTVAAGKRKRLLVRLE